jgi:hypothetical protein
MTFDEWKNARPVRDMFRKLDLTDYLEPAQSWRSLRLLIVEFNDGNNGNFVEFVRDCNGAASSGERILLHAICYVCDFAWLADELSGTANVDGKPFGAAWRNMDRANGEHRRCVAACIGAEW